MCRTFYDGAEWIGNIENKYKGAMWKAKTIFNNSDGVVYVILFNPHNNNFGTLENLKKIKEEIRKLYDIHFHSIHSSDNHTETIRYSKIFFILIHNYYLKKERAFFLKALK